MILALILGSALGVALVLAELRFEPQLRQLFAPVADWRATRSAASDGEATAMTAPRLPSPRRSEKPSGSRRPGRIPRPGRKRTPSRSPSRSRPVEPEPEPEPAPTEPDEAATPVAHGERNGRHQTDDRPALDARPKADAPPRKPTTPPRAGTRPKANGTWRPPAGSKPTYRRAPPMRHKGKG